VEAWTSIRYLHAQGTPIRAMCRELGVSRKAVRRALRREGPPKYERPAKPNPKLAPFEAQIRTWYFSEKLIGSRILRELQARGYDGHRSALSVSVPGEAQGRGALGEGDRALRDAAWPASPVRLVAVHGRARRRAHAGGRVRDGARLPPPQALHRQPGPDAGLDL
jgi:hypothetical protein